MLLSLHSDLIVPSQSIKEDTPFEAEFARRYCGMITPPEAEWLRRSCGICTNSKSVNIGARLDRLPNSGWHIKMWLVSAFALLVCWSNGIGGAVQNILLNELHWLEEGSALLAMWGTTYTAGQLFGALVGGPIGDKIGSKKSILLY